MTDYCFHIFVRYEVGGEWCPDGNWASLNYACLSHAEGWRNQLKTNRPAMWLKWKLFHWSNENEDWQEGETGIEDHQSMNRIASERSEETTQLIILRNYVLSFT